MQTFYVTKIGDIHCAIGDVQPVGDSVFMITRINVPVSHRSRGYGSSILRKIIADANAEYVMLCLEPVASGGLTQKKLEAWYERYGFAWGNDNMMWKAPITS